MINSESKSPINQSNPSSESASGSQSDPNNSFPSSSEENNEEQENGIQFNPTRGELLILKENPQRSKSERGRKNIRSNLHHPSLKKKDHKEDLNRSFDDDEEEKQHVSETLEKFLSTGKRLLYIQIFISSLASFGFIFYVICTYQENLFHYLDYIDIIISFIFFLNFMIKLIIAVHKVSYFFSFQGITDFVIMIFPLFCFVKNEIILKIVNISRVLKVLTAFQIISNIQSKENNVQRQVITIITTLTQIILIAAGVIQLVEASQIKKLIKITNDPIQLNSYKMNIHFHHYVYLIIMILTTVGYGDISPKTELSKLIFMGLVILGLTFIPLQITELIQLTNDQSEYAKFFYKATKDIPHVILVGNITVNSLRSFIQELFHPDHGSQYRHAVIISPFIPTKEMEIFLNENKNFIYYLQGSPFQEKDLLRGDTSKAKACFIFNNKNSKFPKIEDESLIFLGVKIKKYVYNYYQDLAEKTQISFDIMRNCFSSFHLCIQLNKPSSSFQYFRNIQNFYKKRMKQDQLIVIESIKMNLLSKSCLTPGIMALITNLVMSSGDCNNNESEWLKEYAEGRGHEIYRIQLQDYYKQMNFLEVVENVYKQAQAIVFALEVEVSGVSIVKLNPTSNMKINEIITKARDINNTDKTKESRGCFGKDNNSINSEIISYQKEKTMGPNSIENKIRLFAYLICSDKSVADEIANKDKDKSKTKIIVNEKFKEGMGELMHSSLIPQHLSSSIHPRDGTQNVSCVGTGIESDSDSEDEEDDEEDMMELGDFSINKNDYYINTETERYLRNNVEIMHHSIKDREDITNHIVICGLHPALMHFILPLRAKYLQEDALKWIVILAPTLPQELFESLTKFNRIILYFI